MNAERIITVFSNISLVKFISLLLSLITTLLRPPRVKILKKPTKDNTVKYTPY